MFHSSRTALGTVLLVLGLVFTPVPARAQSQATTGVIEGTVSDAQGGRLPGATVTLTNTGTNFTRQLVTDENGRFQGLLLPLGMYKLSAELTGFGSYVQEGIELNVGSTATIQVVLQVASVQQEVTVTADSPIVQTSRSDASTLINQQSISGLPNNGRNVFAFMQLTPGVTIVQGADGDEISVNGQKGTANNISVDGADFNNPFFGEQRGGQRPAFTFNQDAVKEMVVVADGAAPEFGRSGAGFVQIVTKSGTNDVHGTGNFFFKHDGLSSKPDGSDKFPFDQEQFGATIGGPLKQDRLFYFVAYDEQQFDQRKQLDPARIEQRVVDFLAQYGLPNENAPIERTNDARVFLGKVDYQLNSANLLSLKYNYTWSRQDNGTFDVDSWGSSANGVERDYSNAVSGSLVSTLGPTLLNEFRFQLAREDRPRPYDGPQVPGQSRPFPDTAFDFGGGYRVGMPFFLPVDYYDTRVQFVDNLSWVKGRHTFKTGFEFNRVDSVQTFRGFANGRYIFGSTDGFMNYVTLGPTYVECSDHTSNTTGHCPAGTSITGPLLLFLQQAGVGGLTAEEAGTQSIPQLEPALFIQDKWQPTATLTVQYGIRWEAQIQPDPITPPSEVFYAPFIGKPGFPSDGTIPSDKALWQPRLGVSWDPNGDGRQVLRISAGLFYSRIPGLALASSRSTNGSRGQSLYRDSTFNGFGLTPPAWLTLIPQSAASEPNHPQVYVFDKNFQNPRTGSVTVGYERELVANMSVFANYTHSKTVHMYRFIDRNDPVFGSPWATGLGTDGTNGIGQLTTIESSAKSLYDGLTVGMNKKYAQNWQFQWNYTLSKDISDDDNERDPFTYRYAVANNLKPEYNYSDRDQRHRFNAWLLADTKGFQFNTRISYRSASPISVGDTPQARIQPDGTIIKRNTLRKDNEFFTWDFRVSRPFRASGVTIEPILDVFNLTNSKNIRRPATTNLIFNFDGTVSDGLGDPRQAQIGVRIRF